jgi:hypothetical protein
MANLRDVMVEVAQNNTLTAGAKSIEQKQRNTIKRDLTEALYDVLAAVIDGNELLALYRTKDGIMVGIDNAKVGIIPVGIKVEVKNLDVDPAEEEDAFREHQAQRAEAKARAEASKAAKIERQAKERELRNQLREVKMANAALRLEK